MSWLFGLSKGQSIPDAPQVIKKYEVILFQRIFCLEILPSRFFRSYQQTLQHIIHTSDTSCFSSEKFFSTIKI
jgi:hypothetical protein